MCVEITQWREKVKAQGSKLKVGRMVSLARSPWSLEHAESTEVLI
jgi:hypothetical protein